MCAAGLAGVGQRILTVGAEHRERQTEEVNRVGGAASLLRWTSPGSGRWRSWSWTMGLRSRKLRNAGQASSGSRASRPTNFAARAADGGSFFRDLRSAAALRSSSREPELPTTAHGLGDLWPLTWAVTTSRAAAQAGASPEGAAGAALPAAMATSKAITLELRTLGIMRVSRRRNGRAYPAPARRTAQQTATRCDRGPPCFWGARTAGSAAPGSEGSEESE